MKILQLLRVANRWYVWSSLGAALVGFFVLFSLTSSGIGESLVRSPDETLYNSAVGRTFDSLRAKYPTWSASVDPELFSRNRQLASLLIAKTVIDHLPQYVLLPACVVGSGGYLLELLSRRLRQMCAKHAALIITIRRYALLACLAEIIGMFLLFVYANHYPVHRLALPPGPRIFDQNSMLLLESAYFYGYLLDLIDDSALFVLGFPTVALLGLWTWDRQHKHNVATAQKK